MVLEDDHEVNFELEGFDDVDHESGGRELGDLLENHSHVIDSAWIFQFATNPRIRWWLRNVFNLGSNHRQKTE